MCDCILATVGFVHKKVESFCKRYKNIHYTDLTQ